MLESVKVALIGAGIGLSRTPAMHMAEAAAQGLAYTYDLIDADHRPGARLADLLDAAQAEGRRGLNVTHPYKRQVMELLDELSESAARVGAVNTVVFEVGRRIGYNTDHWGFAEAFRRDLPEVPRGRVLLLGAGGAGVAVAHALCDSGVAKLWIRDPDTQAAQDLARAISARGTEARVAASADTVLPEVDGIVNATPIGMAAHPGMPLPVEDLTAGTWVADVIYFPLETQLLAAARARGCRVMNGAGMAVFQAVRAFELFTGRRADAGRMRAAFDAAGPGSDA